MTKLLCWMSLVGSWAVGCLATAASPPTGHRNIIVIVADDHALGVAGVYGNSIVRTPYLDELGAQGLTFTRAYCNAPICSASRQSMLTGKYPHATGVNLLFTPFPDEGNITIAEHLREQGFKTALVGKDHWNNWAWWSLYAAGPPQHGFDRVIGGDDYRQFRAALEPDPLPPDRDYYDSPKPTTQHQGAWMNAGVLPHAVRDAESSGTFYAESAIRFMEENRAERFFLWLAFEEPHHPFYFPVEFAGKYEPADMPLPQGSPEDDRWIPERFQGLSDEEKRGIIAAYYTSTEYLDKNIGLVLDAVERLDLREDTLVLYTSDNGYLLNHHKRFEKHTMWEEAIRQPLILRTGEGDAAGRQTDALVDYVDIVPTLLELVGVPDLSEVQGQSFARLMADPDQGFRDVVFSTYLQDNMAMVRDEAWKYVFHTGSRDLSIGYATGHGPSGIVHRLYHLPSDPTENRDVSGVAENAGILRHLQEVMLQRFMATHPEAADCPAGLTLEGKLVWFCEPRDIGYDQEPAAIPTRVFQP